MYGETDDYPSYVRNESADEREKKRQRLDKLYKTDYSKYFDGFLGNTNTGNLIAEKTARAHSDIKTVKFKVSMAKSYVKIIRIYLRYYSLVSE